jgi:riboflavin synthase
MFTGIVETTANVLKNTRHHLVLQRPAIFDDIKIGSSIAVSGVCLSVVHFDDTSMSFDVVEETLHKTKLGSLKKGDRVNVERAMKASDRLDGHIVQGHVDATGIVEKTGNQLTVILPDHLTSSVFLKGSITIDGVSLTVASLHGNQCSIAIIPHTLTVTTLADLREKDEVNIEIDILARYSRSSPKTS